MKVSKNIRKTEYGKFRFETETVPPMSKTFDTLEEAEKFRDKILLERGVKPGARRVSDPDIGKYTGVEGQKHIKFNGKTYEVLIQRAGKDIKPKYFKTLKEAKEARDNLVKEFPPQKQRGVVSDRVLKEARDKRKTRIATTAPLAATGTRKFAFHHIMPIGGEVPLTTNDIAVINQKMNGALSGFNRELNSIADGITNAYNKQPPDLKKVDQLNKAGESIVRKATKELPKEYRQLIGFNKLQPIFDEYGTVINLSPERVGGVNQKTPGIKLENLTKQEATELKNQIKTDALSLEKSTTKDKIFSGKNFSKGKVGLAAAALAGITGAAVADEPPIKYNDEIGAFVDPLNDEKVSQATMLDWAANNPMPTAAVASAPLLSKTVRKGAGKLLKGLLSTLGSSAAGLTFAGATVKGNLEEGKNIVDATVDPMVGIELLYPEAAKRFGGKGLQNALGRALSLGRVGAMMTPVGAGITALGLGKMGVEALIDERERVLNMTPEELEIFRAEQEEQMGMSA